MEEVELVLQSCCKRRVRNAPPNFCRTRLVFGEWQNMGEGECLLG